MPDCLPLFTYTAIVILRPSPHFPSTPVFSLSYIQPSVCLPMPIGPKPKLCLMDKKFMWGFGGPTPQSPSLQGREPGLCLREILTRLCHLSQAPKILQANNTAVSEIEGARLTHSYKTSEAETMLFSLSLLSGHPQTGTPSTTQKAQLQAILISVGRPWGTGPIRSVLVGVVGPAGTQVGDVWTQGYTQWGPEESWKECPTASVGTICS